MIVAATAGVDARRLGAALLDNPAGNGAQQTPLVLVRLSPPAAPPPQEKEAEPAAGSAPPPAAPAENAQQRGG